MKHTANVKRGDIYCTNLNPVVRSVQGNMRPVIIVQNDTGNAHSPTTQIVLLTAQTQKGRLPTHVPISKGHGLTVDSIALVKQLRTIDKSRLRSYIGAVTISKIDKQLHPTLAGMLMFGVEYNIVRHFPEYFLD